MRPTDPRIAAAATPGPWRTDAGRDQIMVFGPHTSQSSHIATIPIDGAEDEANARLIVAAPDLLAALTKLVPFLGDLEQMGFIGDGDIIQVKDAIAKATGAP